MLQMQPFSGNQRPDLLTALMNMSLVLRLPRKMHLCRSSSNVPRLPSFVEMLQNPPVLLTFDKVHNPLRLPRKTTSERPKVLRTRQCFTLLTSKCASRHNGVHLFDITTSKSGPNLVCFVLHATTTCTFSSSQLPKVVRTWCVLYILTSKCASRHNGVHFFIISTPKSGPNMVCFVHFDFKCASRHKGVHFFDISTSKSGLSMVCLAHFELEMCFAPQRRALFRHVNFQKWSAVGFVHFDLEMCFAPQRRAIFHLSSGQLAPHPPL